MDLDNCTPHRDFIISADYPNFNDSERLANILATELDDLPQLRIATMYYHRGIKVIINFGREKPSFDRLEVDGFRPQPMAIDYVGQYDYEK